MKQFQQVCVSGFLLNNKGEVLMVKRSMEDDFLPGYWEVPGGGTDFDEHPVVALQRELKEEAGLDVEVEKPFYVDDYFMEKSFDTPRALATKVAALAQDKRRIHRVEIFFICHKKDAQQEVVLSHEHSEYRWIGKDNVSSVEMTEYMQKAMDAFFLHHAYQKPI